MKNTLDLSKIPDAPGTPRGTMCKLRIAIGLLAQCGSFEAINQSLSATAEDIGAQFTAVNLARHYLDECEGFLHEFVKEQKTYLLEEIAQLEGMEKATEPETPSKPFDLPATSQASALAAYNAITSNLAQLDSDRETLMQMGQELQGKYSNYEAAQKILGKQLGIEEV